MASFNARVIFVSALATGGLATSMTRHDHLRGASRHEGETRYFLLQYSNKFCGGGVGACQELFNDGLCHLTGTNSESYVQMVDNNDGTMTVKPGDDDSCSCHNADALTATYVVDELDRYGEWKAKQNKGCSVSTDIGVRLVKGEWCEEDTFTRCPPSDTQFTELIKSCPTTNLNANISSGGMCNYPGFFAQSSEEVETPSLEEKEQAAAANNLKALDTDAADMDGSEGGDDSDSDETSD
eukprot:TRINITY_DN110701_c0_g1_i1.p1 TRINITY_DN110701_c0_g1~~TRINITY_DN110701_c0_g1_i1.p1  ORF type:complete len:239 (-),score=70.69 TRINITY_DN110701_c0_g1_i1:81-797(-)